MVHTVLDYFEFNRIERYQTPEYMHWNWTTESIRTIVRYAFIEFCSMLRWKIHVISILLVIAYNMNNRLHIAPYKNVSKSNTMKSDYDRTKNCMNEAWNKPFLVVLFSLFNHESWTDTSYAKHSQMKLLSHASIRPM